MLIKNFRLTLLISSLLLSTVVHAVDIPRSSDRDSRIQYVEYRENDVVLLNTIAGKGSRIVFSESESIINIASGYTDGWEFVPVNNELFISAKSIQTDNESPFITPIPGEWDTNLMVTTSRGLYDFEIKLLAKDGRKDGARTFYRIQFEYPDQNSNRAGSTRGQAGQIDLTSRATSGEILDSQSDKTSELVELDLKKRLPPRNDQYSMSIGNKSAGIAPSMAYDDGLFTYLKFANNLDIPSAYLVRKNGDEDVETLINGHVDTDRPEYIVLHRVAKVIRLRLDKAVVDIYNDNFNPTSVSASNGTTVPGTKRVLKVKGDN